MSDIPSQSVQDVTMTAQHDPTPQSEITRLGALFSVQSILFTLLCTCGLLAGAGYIFGFSIGGERLLEAQYYWVFIGIFVAAAFI
ncbi:MAG: C4-dicarboxylate ABC transporter permease, partial [Pseudodonghicola sp.]